MKIRVCFVLAAGMAVLGLCGCVSNTLSGAFGKNGLPKEKYYVGGGFSVSYQAPVSGVVYVVDKSSGRLLVTESLEKENVYNLPIDPCDEDHQRRLKAMGVNPKNMKLALYFVPTEKEGSQNKRQVPEKPL